MTLIKLIHSQNEMIRLKGTSAHEEQKKIVNEQKKKLPLVMVAQDNFELDWNFAG